MLPADVDRRESAASSSSFSAVPNPSSWSGVFARVGAALGKLNPSGASLRRGLVPGAYDGGGDMLLRHVHPGEGAQVRSLDTVLNGQVDTRFYPALNADRAHVVIVTFHGNGCTADAMDDMWQHLRHEGNVLAVNLPGYGDSSAPADGSELELHMAGTAQAARDYVLQELGFSPAHIVWYGLSLGGSAGAIAFAMTPGSHLAVDKTFTSATAVVGNVLRGVVGGLGGMLASLASVSGLPRGLQHRDLAYTTDGLNTAAKLAKIRAEGVHATAGSRLLVLGGAADELMEASYPATLAHAFYGEDVPEGRLYVQPGAGHCSGLSRTSMRLLRDFLRLV